MAKIYSKVNWGTNTQVGFEPLNKMDVAIDALDTKTSVDNIVGIGRNYIQYESGKIKAEFAVSLTPNANGMATIEFPVTFKDTNDLFVFVQPRWTYSQYVQWILGDARVGGCDVHFTNFTTGAPITTTQVVNVTVSGYWK